MIIWLFSSIMLHVIEYNIFINLVDYFPQCIGYSPNYFVYFTAYIGFAQITLYILFYYFFVIFKFL